MNRNIDTSKQWTGSYRECEMAKGSTLRIRSIELLTYKTWAERENAIGRLWVDDTMNNEQRAKRTLL